MMLTVDLDSPVPPYEQVRSQLAALIDAEVLAIGARLPSIRQLAGDLGLATNTVQRAYRELESAGLIKSRGRHGTIVLQRAKPAPGALPVTPAMQHVIDRLVSESVSAGASLDELLRAVRVAYLSIDEAAKSAKTKGAGQ